jgi:chromosome segregation ATPase
MNCANKALIVLMLTAVLGVWGCTQNRGSSGSARIRDLEARNAKLEEDYRAAVADAAQVRKKLTAAETQAARLAEQAKELEAVCQERDRLRQQVSTAVSEKNAVHAQLVQFGRELQNLAVKIDAAATGQPAPPPVTSAAQVSAPGPS